jgi:hypothetical protein
MTTSPLRRTLAVLGLVALMGAGCARLHHTGSGSGSGLGAGKGSGSGDTPSPSASNNLVLRVETAGGFVVPSYRYGSIPSFSLYADGLLIEPGAQTEIYPQRALLEPVTMHIDPAGMQAILDAAREAGLFGPDVRYTTLTVADVGTTTFTLVSDGQRHTISVYGLGIDSHSPQMTEDERLARQRLNAFEQKLTDLQSWLPSGSVTDGGAYQPTGVEIYVQDGAPADTSIKEPVVDWPLSIPLASFGDPLQDQNGWRCGTVAGSDFSTLLPAMDKATSISPWTSNGSEFSLTFRPLLPDETHCPNALG